MFRRVLFPTDFSAYATAVMNCLPELKAAGTREVLLLGVIRPAEIPLGGSLDRDVLEEMRWGAQERLYLAQQALEGQGLVVRTRLEVGPPAPTIRWNRRLVSGACVTRDRPPAPVLEANMTWISLGDIHHPITPGSAVWVALVGVICLYRRLSDSGLVKRSVAQADVVSCKHVERDRSCPSDQDLRCGRGHFPCARCGWHRVHRP
ncbi:MAG: hypothetical protein Kow0047_28400 [Anaerolineae bacterium]